MPARAEGVKKEIFPCRVVFEPGQIEGLKSEKSDRVISECNDRFSELLALVEQGGEVIVCRRNVPLARVEPIRKPAPRKPQHSVVGCMKGTVRIHGDLTEPCLPEADWEMLK